MKLNSKTNYFTLYLKQKQQQFKEMENKNKAHYTQSTCVIHSNSKSKKRKECLNELSNKYNSNKKKLKHQKTISSPIDLIIPSPTTATTPNIVKYPNKDNNINVQSNDFLINFPLPKQLPQVPEVMPFKRIGKIEKKIHDLLEVIEVFERENNLSYEPFKAFYYESNTGRYAENSKNRDDKKYISPPHSARCNVTINNLSLSSKESTHYLSKKISHQMNNNLNEAISKTYLNESHNTQNQYQSQSHSMKKTKHNYPKLIGLKQNMVKSKESGMQYRQVKTMNYHKPKMIHPQIQIRTYNDNCCNKTEKSSYTKKYIKTQSKNKEKTESSIKDSLSNLVLAKNNCIIDNNNNNKIINNSHSKPRNTLIKIKIKKFAMIKETEDKIISSKSQCQSERNKKNKIKSIFFDPK